MRNMMKTINFVAAPSVCITGSSVRATLLWNDSKGEFLISTYL